MAVKIVYGSNSYPIPEGHSISVDEARDVLVEYFPEVKNAQSKVTEDENGTTIEFIKKSGKLG